MHNRWTKASDLETQPVSRIWDFHCPKHNQKIRWDNHKYHNRLYQQSTIPELLLAMHTSWDLRQGLSLGRDWPIAPTTRMEHKKKQVVVATPAETTQGPQQDVNIMVGVDSRCASSGPPKQDIENNGWLLLLQIYQLKQLKRLPYQGAWAVLLTFPLLDFSTSWALNSYGYSCILFIYLYKIKFCVIGTSEEGPPS